MLNYQRCPHPPAFGAPERFKFFLVAFTGFSECFWTSIDCIIGVRIPNKPTGFHDFSPSKWQFRVSPIYGQPQMRGETEVFHAVSDAQTQQNETHRHPLVVPCVQTWNSSTSYGMSLFGLVWLGDHSFFPFKMTIFLGDAPFLNTRYCSMDPATASGYPLVNIQKAMENGQRNSGFFPLKMVIFHGKLLVHQRVYFLYSAIQCWWENHIFDSSFLMKFHEIPKCCCCLLLFCLLIKIIKFQFQVVLLQTNQVWGCSPLTRSKMHFHHQAKYPWDHSLRII